jgi:hypothetical protein
MVELQREREEQGANTQQKPSDEPRGRTISPTSRWAVSWCAVGAIRAATSNATTREVHEACARLRSAMGLIDIIVFNERQKSVEKVLAAFDRAIAASAPR